MRAVPLWQGRNDDTMPPAAVRLRIIDRQNNCCALTGVEFRGGDKIEFDHIQPLWLGGSNSEGNLQAVLAAAHKRKTQAEATVRAKVASIRKRHLGLHKPKSRPMPGSKQSGLKRGFDGKVSKR